MSILRTVRTEVAGAWRSLRYDLGRRSATVDTPEERHPDVTSAGLSTFVGPPTGLGPYSTPTTSVADSADPYRRPPRRLLAVSAFGLLALIGAAGSYLAVASGFGGLVADRPTAQEPVPLVAEPDGATPALGRPIRPPLARTPGGPLVTRPDRPRPDRSGLPGLATPRPRDPRPPIRPVPAAPPVPTPTCACPAPPAPTPTSVRPPSGTPTGTPTPSPSSPSPQPSPTIQPSDGAVGPPRESRGY